MPISLSGTNGVTFPSWTTATRPAAPAAGQTGFNTTTGQLESYDGTNWEIYTAATTQGTSGQFLRSNGSGVAPSWAAAGLATAAVQTGNFTAVAGNIYPVNTTSGAITVTLPASPSAGNFVTIVDYARTFATNNCTVSPNGNKIQSSTNSAVFYSNGAAVNFVYVDSTQGWISYAYTTSIMPLLYNANYLIVAGGGGGGKANGGGGGGAGGLLSGTTTLSPGTTYSFVVGAGGTFSASGTYSTSGNNSTALSLTAIGGGFGGASDATSTIYNPGGTGGSGGGSGTNGNLQAGASGTVGQGNAGGAGKSDSSTWRNGGGGGGAGGVGADASTGTGTNTANGGVGLSSSITGSSVFYAGGGGGGGYPGGGASGGNGGGGNAQAAGTANRGGGGGGASTGSGGNGGSGVVIISIPTANYTGTTTGSPTVSTSGSNTILTFTASGSYTA